MNLLDERMDTRIPRLVWEILSADAKLSVYFRAIGEHDLDDVAAGDWQPPALPYLAVLAPTWDDETGVGSVVYGVVPVGIYAFTRPPTRANPALAATDAPIVSVSGSGTLTGSFRYATARFTSTGVSHVQEVTGDPQFSAAASCSSSIVTLTLPSVASGEGLSLYRTEASGELFLLRKRWGFDQAPATWDDGVVGDSAPDLGEETAPIRREHGRLMSYIKAKLRQTRLTFQGRIQSSELPKFRGFTNQINREANIRIVGAQALYSVKHEAKTGDNALDAA